MRPESTNMNGWPRPKSLTNPSGIDEICSDFLFDLYCIQLGVDMKEIWGRSLLHE
jgi:hypothetical protein